jgi:eukaryotic-like serine/threonine-protein kinase
MSRKLKHSFLFHLCIVIALCTLLYISFFASLHCFTKHGQELTIPNVTGKNVNAAVDQLKALKFEVNIDSTYEPSQKPLSILKQLPDSGSVVKEGRTVFLTVNMLNPPHIPMPNLVSLSYRSAAMLLHNNKLLVGDTTFKPDIAGGAILEQTYKGAPIRPGEMVPQGARIGLVIGNGLGNTDLTVPDLITQPVDVAMDIVAQNNLIGIITVPDQLTKITDTASAIVVETEPHAFNDAGVPNPIKAGQVITLIIMQNPGPDDFHSNRKKDPTVKEEKPTKSK